MRIFWNYAYICNHMKERLNLTIDGALLESMKVYAAGKDMSVSELVENYFLYVTRSVQHNNILDLMDRMEPPAPRGREGGMVEAKEGGSYGV
jgi:hypothetical protein